MQVYSDRFETVLPKAARFFTPKPQAQPKAKPVWGYLIIGFIIGAVVVAIPKQQEAPALAPVVAAAPTPPPLPELPAPRSMPMPVTTAGSVPRAQLLHVRPIGTVENDRMPDGRVLSTRYMGELSSAAHLPTRGAQLGDMWFTRNDGHCWVLAPLGAGSATIGWVDP